MRESRNTSESFGDVRKNPEIFVQVTMEDGDLGNGVSDESDFSMERTNLKEEIYQTDFAIYKNYLESTDISDSDVENEVKDLRTENWESDNALEVKHLKVRNSSPSFTLGKEVSGTSESNSSLEKELGNHKSEVLLVEITNLQNSELKENEKSLNENISTDNNFQPSHEVKITEYKKGKVNTEHNGQSVSHVGKNGEIFEGTISNINSQGKVLEIPILSRTVEKEDMITKKNEGSERKRHRKDLTELQVTQLTKPRQATKTKSPATSDGENPHQEFLFVDAKDPQEDKMWTEFVKILHGFERFLDKTPTSVVHKNKQTLPPIDKDDVTKHNMRHTLRPLFYRFEDQTVEYFRQ